MDCRTLYHGRVDNTPRLQFDDDENAKWPEEQIMNDVEIARQDIVGMILKEDDPGLTRVSAQIR
jgi:hypothetical protein